MPADVVLMKLDVFQGKRKVKNWWSKADYVGVCQVADDVPTDEVQDDSRNVRTIHCNWLYLEATLRGDATPLGGSESISEEGTI